MKLNIFIAKSIFDEFYATYSSVDKNDIDQLMNKCQSFVDIRLMPEINKKIEEAYNQGLEENI